MVLVSLWFFFRLNRKGIMKQFSQKLFLLLSLALGLAACTSPTPTPVALLPTAVPVMEPTASPVTRPTAVPTETNTAVISGLPPVVEYNLGDATITQSRFPQDSRFHEMPVRLNGIIAVPDTDGGPYPVVIIFHGNHPGCPLDEMSVDRWPCAPEVEQPNYQGFDYLVGYLASQGYVALSINGNAENTFGYGEGLPGERLAQLVDMHLSALTTAAAGGQNDFGVALDGRADMRHLFLMGHSRGGEAIVWLAEALGLAAPEAFDQFGYGPVNGLLLLAPAVTFALPAAPSVPMAAILPACDGDVVFQEGQLFYEAARMNPEQSQWAASIWLERGNHNQFNSILGPDPMGGSNNGRTECQPLLTGEEQRTFLLDYTTDFLTAVYSDDPTLVSQAKTRMGLDVQTPAPDSLYGRPARISALVAANNRLTLLIPKSDSEMTANLVGGQVTAVGVSTMFCEEGYYTPQMKPGSEPCKRVNLTIPGDPAMLVVAWEQSGAALRFSLPDGSGDLSEYTTISLRTAVNPLSPLNAQDSYQAFSIQLTDSAGNQATIQTRPTEPALGFPVGSVEEDSFFAGGQFSGRVPMTTIRLPLSDFAGINLADISEVALVFDQTASGSLFMGDLEFMQP